MSRMIESIEQAPETKPPGNDRLGVEQMESREGLEREVMRLKEELASERERYLRTLADFDNYRRRVRQERAGAAAAGRRELLLALLDVMDDFDRALTHVGEAHGAVADGLRLIQRRLDGVLQSNGVTPFESEGRQFDPTVHEAMNMVESDEHESGVVYKEERRGYLWNGELLRPARVIVVR